jgi:hypothetical protein
MSTVSLTWIKGHYQGKKTIAHKLNDTAHELAYNFLRSDQGYYNPNKTVLDPPSLEVSILHDCLTITSNMSQFIAWGLHSNQLRETICKSENWTDKTFDLVDWPAYSKAF